MSDRDGTLHLYVMNGDGTGQVRITKNTGLERSPAWSADGSKLVFSYSPDKTLAGAEIYSIGADGNGLTRLTNNSVEDDFPSLSADGQFLTWSAVTGPNSGAVMVAKSDGSGAQKLSAIGELARTSSFDGQDRIVFAVRSAGTPNRNSKYQIVRVNPDGTGRVQLTSGNSNHFSPTVSPNGSFFVFSDDSSGDTRLNISPMSTFTPQPLVSSVAGDSDPRFAPDGHLVFSSVRDGNPELYSCNADGTSLRRLTTSAGLDRLPSAR